VTFIVIHRATLITPSNTSGDLILNDPREVRGRVLGSSVWIPAVVSNCLCRNIPVIRMRNRAPQSSRAIILVSRANRVVRGSSVRVLLQALVVQLEVGEVRRRVLGSSVWIPAVVSNCLSGNGSVRGVGQNEDDLSAVVLVTLDAVRGDLGLRVHVTEFPS